MTDIHESHYTENVQDHLQQVQHLLEQQALSESVDQPQEIPHPQGHEPLESLVSTQHLTELREN